MDRHRNHLHHMKIKFLFLTLFTSVAIVLSPGCAYFKSSSTVALQASGVTHIGVETGLRTWDAYVGQQVAEIKALEASPDPNVLKAAKERRAKLVNQVLQVKAGYGKYRYAQISFLKVLKKVAQLSPDDPNLPLEQDSLNKALEASNTALTELGSLLTAFGVTIK